MTTMRRFVLIATVLMLGMTMAPATVQAGDLLATNDQVSVIDGLGAGGDPSGDCDNDGRDDDNDGYDDDDQDSDNDGTCDGNDSDDDNDGALDECDPDPKEPDHADYVICVVRNSVQ